MGTFIVQQWKCDRCKEVHDKWPRPNHPCVIVTYSIKEEEWHSQTTKWRELCPRCNDEVLKLLPTLNYRRE